MIILDFIAHRGLHTTNKENTMPAFKGAISSSYFQGFEFDVRMTKDEQFIINHNAFLGNNLIKLTKLATLKKETSILLLEDVLKLETTKKFLIEIKDVTLNLLKLHKLLNKYPNKQFYIMSFHNEVIKKLAGFSRTYRVGILNYVLNTEEKYPYDFICLLNNLTSQNLISNYRKQNIEVFIYGLIKEKNFKFDNVSYIVDDIPLNK